MSMVERVARAIIEANSDGDPISDEQWAAHVDHHRFLLRTHGDDYERARSMMPDAFRRARAAIEAMRYDDGSEMEGHAIAVAERLRPHDAVSVIEAYDGMIDAALKELADG